MKRRFRTSISRVSTHLYREKYVNFNELDFARRSTIFSYLALIDKDPARYGVVKVFILGKERRAAPDIRERTKTRNLLKTLMLQYLRKV